MALKLQGIMSALHTNYDGDGEVTDAGLEEQLSFLIDAGCTGLFVGGSTGEGVLQTVQERTWYTEAVVRTVSGRVPVIAHVGAAATRDACELARRAARIGADAVGSVMPIYFQVGTDAAVEYYRAISAATDLPVLIYYLQSASAEGLNAEVFAEKLAAIPHVFALKYTSPELETFGRIAQLCGDRVCMIMGCDQVLLPALTMGACGAIGTSYNYMPEIAAGIYRHYAAGELAEARRLMDRMFRIIHVVKRVCPPGPAPSREIMRMRGMETGRCRPPLPSPSPQQAAALRRELDAMGFFDNPTG